MSRIAVLLAAKLFLCTDFQVERAPMDVPKAMSILAFSGARSFESTSLPEIEKKFTMRIHALEQYKNPKDISKRSLSSPSPLKVGRTYFFQGKTYAMPYMDYVKHASSQLHHYHF